MSCVKVYIKCFQCSLVSFIDICVTRVFRFHQQSFRNLYISWTFCLLWCPISDSFNMPSFSGNVTAEKRLRSSFYITTLNPKTYHELRNVKDNMNLSKTKSLKVCDMIMPPQKNIFLLPSVENLTACMGRCSTVNAELHCAGGSD